MNWLIDLFKNPSFIYTILGGLIAGIIGFISQKTIDKLNDKKIIKLAATRILLDIQNTKTKLTVMYIICKDKKPEESFTISKKMFYPISYNKNWNQDLSILYNCINSKMINIINNYFSSLDSITSSFEYENHNKFITTLSFYQKESNLLLFKEISIYTLDIIIRNLIVLYKKGKIKNRIKKEIKIIKRDKNIALAIARRFQKPIEEKIIYELQKEKSIEINKIKELIPDIIMDIKKNYSSKRIVINQAIFNIIVYSNKLDLVWGSVTIK